MLWTRFHRLHCTLKLKCYNVAIGNPFKPNPFDFQQSLTVLCIFLKHPCFCFWVNSTFRPFQFFFFNSTVWSTAWNQLPSTVLIPLAENNAKDPAPGLQVHKRWWCSAQGRSSWLSWKVNFVKLTSLYIGAVPSLEYVVLLTTKMPSYIDIRKCF